MLAREIASLGIYPAVDPAGLDLASSTRAMSATSTTGARRVQEILQRYNDLQDIIAILGSTSCPRTTR